MASVPGVLDFANQVALKAGEVIRVNFHTDKEVNTKQCRADLVTESDKKVEDLVHKMIRKRYPDHKFIGEETCSAGEKCDFTDAPTWIIDPIDGTSNFFREFPLCCISIGYCEKRQPVVGVIYNPIRDELYSAEAGKGAYLNGRRISVSKFLDIGKSLIITDLGSQRSETELDIKAENICRVIRKVLGVRSLGSAAVSIAMVGAGNADAYYEYGIHCWDIAAGAVIVKEAGGYVFNCDGSPLDILKRNVLVANSMEVVNALTPLLRHVEYERD